MTAIIFFILFSALVGAIGIRSGRSFLLWFFISVLVSPVISVILLGIFWLACGTLKPTEVSPRDYDVEAKEFIKNEFLVRDMLREADIQDSLGDRDTAERIRESAHRILKSKGV